MCSGKTAYIACMFLSRVNNSAGIINSCSCGASVLAPPLL